MTHQVVVRPQVEDDIAEAADWYETQNKGLGREFVRPGDRGGRLHARPAGLEEVGGPVLIPFEAPTFPYTEVMRSVADDLRQELEDEVNALSIEERLALILRLGERDIELYAQANGLDRETARRDLERQGQIGRSYSKCMSDLIG